MVLTLGDFSNRKGTIGTIALKCLKVLVVAKQNTKQRGNLIREGQKKECSGSVW